LGYEEPQGNQNKIFLKNWVLDAIYVWNWLNLRYMFFKEKKVSGTRV
jgi:hypothetical protein